MILTYQNNMFVIRTSYAEYQAHGEKIKFARFRWDKSRKVWWTDNPDNARLLISCADDTARGMLQEVAEKKSQSLALSSAASIDLDLPCPEGLAYRPFQKAGIAYAMSRERTLIADEMGLGKTIQAIGVINACPDIQRVLVICPASVKINWQRELEKWLIWPARVAICYGNKPYPQDSDILIANYDIVHRYKEQFRAKPWDLLIVDECQYLQSGSRSRRGRYILGGAAYATNAFGKKEKIDESTEIPSKLSTFLSGTPIRNRPANFYPILRYLDPARWYNFMGFAKRFCDAHQEEIYIKGGKGQTKWVWDFKGASHLDELQRILRETIMIRRLKADVEKELPPKTRQMIVLDPTSEQKALLKQEAVLFEPHRERRERLEIERDYAEAREDKEAYARAVSELRSLDNVLFEEMSAIRRELGISKIASIIEHVTDCLESVEKVTVWVHHHEVANQLVEAFQEYGSVILTGQQTPKQKQAAVDAFQDGAARVFVGSILAAGVGINLFSSSLAVFGEQDWVPGNMEQAADRLHRIGQKNNVLCQYLVVDGSLDAKLAQTVLSKEEVIYATLDKPLMNLDIPAGDPKPPSEKKVKTETPGDLNDMEIQAIREMLRNLAGFDPDHARERNEMGFNKIDGEFGHSLAASLHLTQKQAQFGKRLLQKYWRQVPPELYETVFPGHLAKIRDKK
jgi:SWI/SNF-related matrix-associated actin-dependent regulator 1 of chromatin subfamily A